MADINKVILVGRLTRDAELRYANSGLAICRFSLAVNRNKKDGDQWVEEAHFFDIVSFGRQGEAINQYLVKGKQVGVEGELRFSKWEQDGQTRSKVEVAANNIMLLGGGARGGGQSGGQSGGGQDSNSAGERSGGSDSFGRQGGSGNSVDDDFDDDIPF